MSDYKHFLEKFKYPDAIKKAIFISKGEDLYKPFNIENFRNVLKTKHDYELGCTEKIVKIGDWITTDILFGKLNNMVSIWIYKYKDKM